MLWSRKVQTKGLLTITIIEVLIRAHYTRWEDTVHLLRVQVDIDVFNNEMLNSFGVGCGHKRNVVFLNLDHSLFSWWHSSKHKPS